MIEKSRLVEEGQMVKKGRIAEGSKMVDDGRTIVRYDRILDTTSRCVKSSRNLDAY